MQTWLGHKRIDETMLYVHVAEAHAREWPEPVHEAARNEIDPDKRILSMLLGARASVTVAARGSEDERSRRECCKCSCLVSEGRRTRT